MAYSKSFGVRTAVHPHLVSRGKGGVAGEVGDLRGDEEDAFRIVETRSGMPSVDWIDGGAVAVGGANAILKGSNLLQAQTFASRICGTGNAQVTFYAVRPGEDGNDYSVVIVQGAGALSASFTSPLLTVTLAAAGSTATAVATAVNALSGCHNIIRCVAGGTGGSNVVVAAQAALSGGTGEGWTCSAAGVDCPPAHATGGTPPATVAEGVATVTVPALTGKVAGDVIQVIVTSDGVQSLPITYVVPV